MVFLKGQVSLGECGGLERNSFLTVCPLGGCDGLERTPF